MFEQGETKWKRRSVTALALLVGLLLGLPGGSVRAQSDSNTTRLGNGEILRGAAGLRAVGRADDNGADDEALPALLPSCPTVVTELVSARPVAPAAPAVLAARLRDPQFHYRARAPPAA